MTDTAHPYLSEMPDAPCPPGCVVRKGDRIGSVTLNDGELWAVTEHGIRHGRIGTSHGGRGTPEAAGWRHALDRRSGFGYVLQEVTKWRHRNAGYPDRRARLDALLPQSLSMWAEWSIGEDASASRLVALARAFAAVLR